ncbi:MAG TPA: lipid-A-disaccharide synthase [candidate division Zixibacteria bacterium]|nr:lipid-A-disaccharide synthase [candidate division Zixibacteria bacterium]
MASRARRIMLVVGEASGDMHGAGVVRAIHERDPAVEIFGIGGEQLGKTRFEALENAERLAGMGLVELAGKLGSIWAALRAARQALRRRRPDLLLLIDFPEFNLRLARLAKKLGIPVLYYIAPQVWAWRKGRARKIARLVDAMAVVFPFEVGLYGVHGANVSFVGHPLLDLVEAKKERATVLESMGLDPETPTIGLMPGSRRNEVDYHLPVFLEAAARYRSEREVQFFCVRATTVERPRLDELLGRCPLRVPVVEEERYEALNAADLVWAASGTATLEAALLLKPTVIVYRLAWPTYWLARLLVDVEHVGLVNIVAGERVAPELIQGQLTPEALVRESRRFLDDPQVRRSTIEKLRGLKAKLGAPGAARRVAGLAFELMEPARGRGEAFAT